MSRARKVTPARRALNALARRGGPPLAPLPPPPAGALRADLSPELETYLSELAVDHRPRGLPERWALADLAREAEQGRFNPVHVGFILIGRPGPWLAPGVPGHNLVREINRTGRAQAWEPIRAEQYRAWKRRERKVTLALNAVRSITPFAGRPKEGVTDNAEKARVIAALERQRFFKPGGRLKPLLTQQEAQQWITEAARALVPYLARTLHPARGRRDDVVVGRREFGVVARILSLVTATKITTDSVKARYSYDPTVRRAKYQAKVPPRP